MQLKITLMLILLCNFVNKALCADNNSITVTITNAQWSLFKRMTIPVMRPITYATIASIISSHIFADGDLWLQRYGDSLDDVTMSSAHYKGNNSLYFVSDSGSTNYTCTPNNNLFN